MVALSSLLARRYSMSLQQTWTHEIGIIFRRFFPSQKADVSTYVGAPEYPIPGTKSYTESIERLKDPRVLETLSRKSPKYSNQSNTEIQEWMRMISDQNAQLLREMNRLTQKVEKLETRLENP
jgi:hypothetical protein